MLCPQCNAPTTALGGPKKTQPASATGYATGYGGAQSAHHTNPPQSGRPAFKLNIGYVVLGFAILGGAFAFFFEPDDAPADDDPKPKKERVIPKNRVTSKKRVTPYKTTSFAQNIQMQQPQIKQVSDSRVEVTCRGFNMDTKTGSVDVRIDMRSGSKTNSQVATMHFTGQSRSSSVKKSFVLHSGGGNASVFATCKVVD